MTSFLLSFFSSAPEPMFQRMAQETTMFKMGVLFGLIGILLLAGRQILPSPAPKDQEKVDAYQIELLDGSKEYAAVKSVLDWTIGF